MGTGGFRSMKFPSSRGVLRLTIGSPWLLLPMLPVVLTVLAFSFVGDGLRDAVDPYQH